MRPELRLGVEWWAESPAQTPFTDKNPDYQIAQYEAAEALNEDVEAHFAAAAEADEEGTRFDLVTVLLAVTLFFLGLSTVMRRRATRTGLMAIGAATLAIAIGALLVLVI